VHSGITKATFVRDRTLSRIRRRGHRRESGRRRLAPFVAPIVAGKVVQSLGYETKTFKPAYVKDKRVFDASRPFKRALGERIGGELAPAQRLQLMLAADLSDQLAMLARRQEVMAVEALLTGRVTVEVGISDQRDRPFR
jgi:hypothetical protein